MSSKPSPNPLDVWRRIAPWWDHVLGEGNDFQIELIMPATDRLLAIKPGEVVLDACCGNGNYARRLASGGAKVVAFDGAEQFIEAAKKRATSNEAEIEYHVIDATDESAMLSLGVNRFDAAVCSMAMMDLPTISPMLRAVHALLKPAGRFVFSIPHPCFNSNQSTMTAELLADHGKLEQIYGLKITRYITPTTDLSTGILHQPEPHFLYHRPLQILLSECFNTGFVIDGFEEPTFPANSAAKSAFNWKKRPEIPPAVLLRLSKQLTIRN